MNFGYFHEEESEQFAFYRIPQVLFKDEKFAKLSTDAKVLYGLFLNRVSLSKKNHWIDDEGRVYVYYTLVSIQEDLHCASQKALKLLKELESYGLMARNSICGKTFSALALAKSSSSSEALISNSSVSRTPVESMCM